MLPSCGAGSDPVSIADTVAQSGQPADIVPNSNPVETAASEAFVADLSAVLVLLCEGGDKTAVHAPVIVSGDTNLPALSQVVYTLLAKQWHVATDRFWKIVRNHQQPPIEFWRPRVQGTQYKILYCHGLPDRAEAWAPVLAFFTKHASKLSTAYTAASAVSFLQQYTDQVAVWWQQRNRSGMSDSRPSNVGKNPGIKRKLSLTEGPLAPPTDGPCPENSGPGSQHNGASHAGGLPCSPLPLNHDMSAFAVNNTFSSGCPGNAALLPSSGPSPTAFDLAMDPSLLNSALSAPFSVKPAMPDDEDLMQPGAPSFSFGGIGGFDSGSDPPRIGSEVFPPCLASAFDAHNNEGQDGKLFAESLGGPPNPKQAPVMSQPNADGANTKKQWFIPDFQAEKAAKIVGSRFGNLSPTLGWPDDSSPPLVPESDGGHARHIRQQGLTGFRGQGMRDASIEQLLGYGPFPIGDRGDLNAELHSSPLGHSFPGYSYPRHINRQFSAPTSVLMAPVEVPVPVSESESKAQRDGVHSYAYRTGPTGPTGHPLKSTPISGPHVHVMAQGQLGPQVSRAGPRAGAPPRTSIMRGISMPQPHELAAQQQQQQQQQQAERHPPGAAPLDVTMRAMLQQLRQQYDGQSSDVSGTMPSTTRQLGVGGVYDQTMQVTNASHHSRRIQAPLKGPMGQGKRLGPGVGAAAGGAEGVAAVALQQSIEVLLDVGGKDFVTTMRTIMVNPTSRLAVHVQQNMADGSVRRKIFIDRSGEVFDWVLRYLRYVADPPAAHVAETDFWRCLPENETTLQQILQEAIFYELPNMAKQVSTALANLASGASWMYSSLYLESGYVSCENKDEFERSHASVVAQFNDTVQVKSREGWGLDSIAPSIKEELVGNVRHKNVTFHALLRRRVFASS